MIETTDFLIYIKIKENTVFHCPGTSRLHKINKNKDLEDNGLGWHPPDIVHRPNMNVAKPLRKNKLKGPCKSIAKPLRKQQKRSQQLWGSLSGPAPFVLSRKFSYFGLFSCFLQEKGKNTIPQKNKNIIPGKP